MSSQTDFIQYKFEHYKQSLISENHSKHALNHRELCEIAIFGHRNPILDRLTWYSFKKQQIKCSNGWHKTLRVGSYLYFEYSLAKGRFCWYFCSSAQQRHEYTISVCTIVHANIFVYTKVHALAKCNLFQPVIDCVFVCTYWSLKIKYNGHTPEFELTYCDLGNMIHFPIFKVQIFPFSQKIMILKYNKDSYS